MTFIRFDIDHDKITLDDQIIPRPSYLSPSQWLAFWSYSSSEEMQQKIDQAYKDGSEESEDEHEKEIEVLKSSIRNSLIRINKTIEDIIENNVVFTEDHIKNIKEEVLDLEEQIWHW